MSAIAFRVVGVPQPKGSMRAFHVPGMKAPIVTESNRNVRSWSQLVAAAAGHRMSEADAHLMLGALAVRLVFALPRPKAIKAKRVPHTRKPDLDKLTRAILDALTGVVYRDDAQVVLLEIAKRYADPGVVPSVDVIIAEASVEITTPLFASEAAPC
jgi:crossover junction endodeoxyribonuclease RusA